MAQSAPAFARNSLTAFSRMGCTAVILRRSSFTLPVKEPDKGSVSDHGDFDS